jgi:WD40 repeat protein
VRIWEHRTGACVKSLTGHKGEVYSVTELTQSTKTRGILVCTGGEDGTVRVWTPTGVSGRCVRVLRGHSNNVRCVVEITHPTIKYPPPASNNTTGWLTSRTPRSPTRSGRLTGRQSPTSELDLNPDPNSDLNPDPNSDLNSDPNPDPAEWVDLVCSGSADQTVRVWHWPSGRCVQLLKMGRGVHALTQLSNGRLCVVCDENAWSVWDWVKGERELTCEGHGSYVRSVIQLADGRVCTASLDNTLKLWK